MTIHEIYMILKEHGGVTISIVIILMTFIQIAPIKLNPWSALAKKICKLFTGDLSKRLDTLEKKLDEYIKEADLRDLRKRRESILDFASAVADGRRFTREQYKQIISECDEYSKYCKEKSFPNAVAEESIALIRRAYRYQIGKNLFLTTEGFQEEEDDGN